jgi:5-methylcytosine-specific restriction enzyme B
MYLYYLKKASDQDVLRTTVINSQAAISFFGVNLTTRDDEDYVKITYLPDGIVDDNVKILQKQDIRIFINRSRFEPGDILLFTSLGIKSSSLEVIKPDNSQYQDLSNMLNKRNYHLTNSITGIENASSSSGDENESDALYINFPKNTILYGPPGTGKTDSTVELALKIINNASSSADIVLRRQENRERFNALLNKRIYFITMHPSFSYEDFVEGIKPDLIKESGKTELVFKYKQGAFTRVSEIARNAYTNEGEYKDVSLDNKDILRVCFFLSKFNTKADKTANRYFGSESNGEVFATVGAKLKANPNSIKNHRDKFDFLVSTDRKGWKPNNGSSDTLDNTDLWPYHDIYLELKDKSYNEVLEIVKNTEKKALETISRTENNINYVLILDEINRANISKVFGELITLIEEDKRIGMPNELSVLLPSGEYLSIPPNLYIIGTMNTADKSISLVDIALRRRFQFIPIYPNASVIIEHSKSYDKAEKALFMETLNDKLRIKKGVDFQIGHAYFLKNNSLADVINENVIPLLIEYFRNKTEDVKIILSECGVYVDEEYFIKTGLLRYNV